MTKTIDRFYERFDKFLERATSGNLGLKVQVTAILTGLLILLVIISFAGIAYKEFEITVPAEGVIDKIINDTTIECKVLIDAKYSEMLKVAQKAKIWILPDTKTVISGSVVRVEESVNSGDFSVYLENTSPLSMPASESLIGKKIKCRIVVDKKKVFELLMK